MTYKECYLQGQEALTAAGIEEAPLDARLLLEYVCGTSRNDLLVHGDREVSEDNRKRYEEIISKRAMRIPLQHITGVQEFMGLEFRVSDKVLIPRQDTEILVEEVLRELHDGMRILDMCTGSGCILLSLLHYSNGCEGIGVDISGEALQVAEQNAEALLNGRETDYRFIQGDLFEAVDGKFDIIVSNPPYIPSQVIPTLMPEVQQYEPMLALDGSGDGLFFYRKIAEESGKYLNKGGGIYFEIGHDQAECVSNILAAAGFTEIETVKDYAGLDRVVYATYVGNAE
ncbi:MAG: peptide chain release factor N(5)-glutamine methyltransferase [Lachnospiraceae bacterium]|nr:peptide chain release factor N(5)-glutamine methyltransferase [Lachnospiraceae bacterium]